MEIGPAMDALDPMVMPAVFPALPNCNSETFTSERLVIGNVTVELKLVPWGR